MDLRLQRSLSFVLAITLIAQTQTTSWAFGRRTPESAITASLFNSNALTMRALGMIRAIRPQPQFLSGLLRYSQVELDSKFQADEDRDPQVLASIQRLGQQHLFKAYYWNFKFPLRKTLSTLDQTIFGNLATFVHNTHVQDLFIYESFTTEYKNRWAKSKRFDTGRRFIAINPRFTDKLRELVVNYVDIDIAGFIAADILIDEATELILEDPLENPWGEETPINAPFIEAVVLFLKSVLFRHYHAAHGELGMVALRKVLSELSPSPWFNEHMKAIDALLALPPLAYSEYSPVEQNHIWHSILVPWLSLHYPTQYLGTPIEGLTYKILWAYNRLAEARLPSHAQILGKIKRPEEEKWPYEAREGTRYSQTPMNDESTDPHLRRTAELYASWARLLKLEPSASLIEAVPLMSKQENGNGNGSKTRSQRPPVLQAAQRLQDAFTVPFDFPLDEVMEKSEEHSNTLPIRRVFTIQPNAAVYQMGFHGKVLNSFHELLVVVAKKMALLENPQTPQDIRENLFWELLWVHAPLMNRLGARALGAELRKNTFRAFDPRLHQQIQDRMNDHLGMDEEETQYYQEALAQQIEERLRSFVNVRVEGFPKNPYSVYRKMISKPDYAAVGELEDLIRFRVILEENASIGEVIALIASMSPFTGHVTRKRGKPEAKLMPGYDSYHITLVAVVNGKELAHEFQIFPSPDEHLRYEYEWPNAWWAYSLKQATRVLPDFEPFEVNEQDLEGNFARFKEAIDPYTYFFVPFDDAGKNHTFLIPARIPNDNQQRGNVADSIVQAGAFNRQLSGAISYRLTFDPTAKEQWSSSRRRPLPLDGLIKNGMVVEPARSNKTEAFTDSRLRQIERTASTLLTLVTINDKLRGRHADAITKGQKELFTRIEETIGQPLKNANELTTSIRRGLLNRIALQMSYPNSDALLAAFGLDLPYEYIKRQQQELVERVLTEIELFGANLLEKSGVAVHAPETWRQVELVGHELGLAEDAGHALLLAIGIGHLTVHTVQAQVAQVRSRRMEFARRTPAPLPPQEFVKLNAEFKKIPTGYTLDIVLNHDQSGLTAAILPILTSHGFSVLRGTRTRPTKEGTRTYFVLSNPAPGTSIQSVASEIVRLKIPYRERLVTPHRFNVSLLLVDKPRVLNEFIQELKDIQPEINLLDYLIDADDWIEMVLELPELPLTGQQTPEDQLRNLLTEMQARLKLDGEQLIKRFEISNDNVSEATTALILERLNSYGTLARMHKAALRLIATAFRQNIVGTINFRDVELSERAMDLARRMHAGEYRKEKRHPPYHVHPLNSTATYIRAGGRDLISFLIEPLHDTVENWPREEFKRRYPNERVPGWDDPRLAVLQTRAVEMIAEAFPDLKHQIIKGVIQLTYASGTLARYAREMAERGDHRLSARKLAENEDNLRTIFNVEDKANKDFSAADQIAKSMRYWLPLVTQESDFKNDLYRNSRIIWLRTWILQTERLTDEQFLKLLYVQEDKNESVSAVRQEVAQTLKQFLIWHVNNEDAFPNDLGEERVQHFFGRLQLLIQTLEGTSSRKNLATLFMPLSFSSMPTLLQELLPWAVASYAAYHLIRAFRPNLSAQLVLRSA